MATRKPPKSTDRSPVPRHVEVDVVLTRAQVDERGRVLAQKQADKGALDRNRKAAASEWKARLDECELEIQRLAQSIRDGRERAEVACEDRFDDRRGLVVTIRLDTCATVQERAQTIDERQVPLPAPPAPTLPSQKGTSKGDRIPRGLAVVPPDDGAE